MYKHLRKEHPSTKRKIKIRKIMTTGKTPKKIPNYYYNILEDANFHKLNKELERKKVFSNKRPWIVGRKKYEKYRILGGRTWNI